MRDSRSSTVGGRITALERLLRHGRPLVLRSGRGVLRPLWGGWYRAATRAYITYLTAGEWASAYLRSSLVSGEPVYGLSDIDLAFVVAGDRGSPGQARARLRRRRDRVARMAPALGELFDSPFIFEEADLREAASAPTITYRLEEPQPAESAVGSVYHGPRADLDRLRLQTRPELSGPTWDWRLLVGCDRRPPAPRLDAQRRRIVAWLELQYWWIEAADSCVHPQRASAASRCVKLIAESARIWLWLSGEQPPPARRKVLVQALEKLPHERDAIEGALELERALHLSPSPRLAEFLPSFLRISQQIAERITEELEPAGSTVVELGGPDSDLALTHGGWHEAQLPGHESEARLLPLADWRALATPTPPDETFAVIPGDPTNPAVLAVAARAADSGPYPTLIADGLMLRPTTADRGRGSLRAIQCAATDPVSFAVLAGHSEARFPDTTGWSIRDCARRATAECCAWLGHGPARLEPSGRSLGMLIACARAALLLESIAERAPMLAVTSRAAMDALAERSSAERAVAEASAEAYRSFALDRAPPEEATVAALRDAVLRMATYRRWCE